MKTKIIKLREKYNSMRMPNNNLINYTNYEISYVIK